MKNRTLLKALVILLVLTLFSGISCVKKLCFLDNTGTVTVTNSTGKSAYVIVKSGGKTFTSGLLTNGSVKKFEDVPSGSLQVGGSLNNSTWTYLTSPVNLPSCGTAVAVVYTVQ